MSRSIDEIAEKYDIQDRDKLSRMWLYMEEAVELWEEAPKGDDTLDELMEHIQRIVELVEDKHNWAALNNRAHYDKWYWEELKEALTRLQEHAYLGHVQKKPGTKPNRHLHHAVRILMCNVRPMASASVVCDSPSSVRRVRRRSPTCTSIGL